MLRIDRLNVTVSNLHSNGLPTYFNFFYTATGALIAG